MTKNAMKITVTQNGPYRVSGGVPLSKQTIGANAHGESVYWQQGERFAVEEQYELCRCGHSGNKPFCDGTHAKVQFDGAETADRSPYLEQAQVFDGPGYILTDNQSLCAFARFCDPHGQVWGLVERGDPQSQKWLAEETAKCPSGRLVVWDTGTKQPVEPQLDPSIGLVEDPQQACSGPLWVRGGIPVVSADGQTYEMRNRQTLCRCAARPATSLFVMERTQPSSSQMRRSAFCIAVEQLSFCRILDYSTTQTSPLQLAQLGRPAAYPTIWVTRPILR